MLLFDHPEKKFFPILIAGTVGKGSTGVFLESILKNSNIKVGFYNSPHIIDIKERIRIDGKLLISEKWARALSAIKNKLSKNPLPKKIGELTYFEILTFLGIYIFSKSNVQVGIFEVGMGGRLDATNILNAPLTILTRIHKDHEKFLGSTISKIAEEKSKIIKKEGIAITPAKQNREALAVIKKQIIREKGRLVLSSNKKTPMQGVFQNENYGMAYEAAQILKSKFNYNILNKLPKFDQILWKGRLQTKRYRGKNFLLDTAHNSIAAKTLTNELSKSKKRYITIFSALEDKRYGEMIKSISAISDEIILFSLDSPRAAKIESLVESAKEFFPVITVARNAANAIDCFLKIADKDTICLVTGSFYLLEKIEREFLKNA